MAAALGSLVCLLLLCMSMISVALAQYENQFIYHGFKETDLFLDGIAKIQANGLLQLTNTSNRQLGHAFYKLPLKFNKSSGVAQPLSFSTVFVFAMVNQSKGSGGGGHGIAFFISPSMDLSHAAPIEYLGLFNSTNNGLPTNHVFAIELDTVATVDFKDIDQPHAGIDVNGLESIESAPLTYVSDTDGKNRSLDIMSGDPIQVWIDYDEVDMLINVSLAPIRSSKPKKSLLSKHVNLSEIFLETMYMGFSAATGALASDHYVLGWSFNRSGQAQGLEISILPRLPSRKQAKKIPTQLMTIFLVVIVVVLIAISVAVYLRRKKKYEEVLEDWEKDYGPQRFSYKTLYKATKGFKEKEVLGSGGFGKVYKGTIGLNIQIAVKRVWHESDQMMKQFVAEIVSMGRLRHRNLVQLLGYCRRKGELLLVYEYMENGSLDKFLFSNEKPNLNWSQRFEILKGVASALFYLHEEWEQVVLHRDIKASNIMLDSDLNGRLGDFGLAKLQERGVNPQTTDLVGTAGYMAPELTVTGKATTNSDVFAFGAFSLEMACGRRPIEFQRPQEQVNLVRWVLECWKRGAILEAIDPRLEANFQVEEMELVLKLGLLCSHSLPACRPSMRQVMQYLDGNAYLPDVPIDSVGIGILMAIGEESAYLTLTHSSFSKCSAHSMSSADSMLDTDH